uniref:Uncharacterized protein n=1 Tax=Anguilla anguilla TaxID=7936 RepID=A0A0E9XNK0_ANGAN
MWNYSSSAPRIIQKSKWRANNIADIGGPNSVVEHIQMHLSMKFCVDLTWCGSGSYGLLKYDPLL